MRKSQDMWVCTNVLESQEKMREIATWNIVYSKKHAKIGYVDVTATLDIETTNTEDDGYLYTIQFNIGGQNVLFRYVEDFMQFMDWLGDELRLDDERRLIFHIHNLGYEQFYLIQALSAEWGEPNILLTRPHKPLSMRWHNGIEFRDSLKLFQKSLARATVGCEHVKLSGDLDYRVYRTPDTPLSPTEWNYCINDVQGLYEAIERLKQERGYNAATLPMTNTSMVILAVNRECRKDGKVRRAMDELRLNKEDMRLAYKCMAGGDTHGTRWRAGRTYENCNSYDLKSAHPSQQILDVFPAGSPTRLDGLQDEEMLQLYIEEGYGWLGQVFIRDFRVRPECPDPTISYSKCAETEDEYGLDNGRLLGAGGAMVYMDSNDYQRFREAYECEEFIGVEILVFKLRPLPQTFRDAILKFFRVKESAEDGPDRNFAKICVNTIFGACAQKTVRDEYTLNMDDMKVYHLDWEKNLDDKDDGDVWKSQTNKFPFLWGLWTASLSRLKLWNLIKTIGWKKAIYWDTDSCKYEGEKVPEVEAVYNAAIRKRCEERGAVVVNRKGKEVYIGSAEDEHPTVEYGYRRFRFLHAKCYAAESWDGEKYVVESTIAGVGKTEGKVALGGDIDNLRDGLYIANAGGLKLVYHPRQLETRTRWSRPTMVGSYIYMSDRDYEVNGKPPQLEAEPIAG